MYFIHKDLKSKVVKDLSEEEINYYLNNGWKKGKCPSHWINNGKENKLLKEGLPLPEGFVFGQSDSFKAKNSESGKKRWANASKEEKDKWSKSISIATKEMWDNISDEDKALREKHRFETRAGWTEEEIAKYSLKMSESAIKERASRSKEKIKESCDKGFKTRKKKGNSNTSKVEDRMYNFLVEKFSFDGVERNYNKDSRYPYHCDFYIKSLDLFVELNAHWTHGGKPFDPDDKECQKQLALWEEKAKYSQYHRNAIKTWTERDVIKINTALDNNINYITLYSSEDILNFKTRIKEKDLLYEN